MTHRGPRYFEQPLPDPNANDDPAPQTRQTPFHSVFGNRKVRRFQQEGPGIGPGRGRRNVRGRGRNNRGRLFYQTRNPNMRYEEGDPHEATDDYRNAGRGRPFFGGGSKRPAFQPIEFDGRRKKKYVPGGRIKKFERIDEYSGDTYCEVCDEGFRDVNAKALHDRSKRHRLNFGYLRHEVKENEDQDKKKDETDVAKTSGVSAEERRRNLEKGMAAFLSKPLPKDFKEWAERSLTAARRAASESNDPSLFQAVQREVIEVHRVNSENCTLRRVCWTRRDVATGNQYRESSLASTSLPVIKDSELCTGNTAEAIGRKEESRADQQPSTVSSVSAPRKAPVEEVDDEPEDSPVEVEDEAPPLPPPLPPPTAPHMLSSVPRPADTSAMNGTPLPKTHLPPYKDVKLNWRLSKAAKVMLACCRIEHRETVLAKYNSVFGDAANGDKDSAHEESDVKQTESVINAYRDVRREFDSEKYEYEDLMGRMSTLAKQLGGDGKRVAQLRDVLQMQTKIALQVGEFRDCHQPCSAYVRTFSQPRSVRGKSIDMIGQWFISILFKERPGRSQRGFTAMLQIAQEMRGFPAGAGEDVWVHESIEAVRCVLGLNWSGFFTRSMELCRASPVSQMLEGLVPFMKEKALLMSTCMNREYVKGNKAEPCPVMPLCDFQRCLNWNGSDDVEASIEDAKEFITSLPQQFEIVRNSEGQECVQWRGSSDDELTISKDIDVREDILSKWSKIRVLEEDSNMCYTD